MDRPQLGEPGLHGVVQRLVSQVHIGEFSIAALGRQLAGMEEGRERGDRVIGLVGVPVVAAEGEGLAARFAAGVEVVDHVHFR